MQNNVLEYLENAHQLHPEQIAYIRDAQRMHYSLGFQVNEMRLLRLIQYPSAPRI